MSNILALIHPNQISLLPLFSLSPTLLLQNNFHSKVDFNEDQKITRCLSYANTLTRNRFLNGVCVVAKRFVKVAKALDNQYKNYIVTTQCKIDIPPDQ